MRADKKSSPPETSFDELDNFDLGGRPRAWKLGSFSVVIAFIAGPFGAAANLVAAAFAAIAVPFGLVRRRRERLASIVVILGFALLLWWLIGLANPNVLSLNAGLLGFRKSMLFVIGLLVGVVWVGWRRAAFKLIWVCIALSCAASLLLFLFLPDVEASISRAAGEYTALFAGERRLQGVFAGPFHAALASTFLILSSFTVRPIINSRAIRVLAFGLGVWVLVLTQVRSGMVAVVIGLFVLVLAQREFRARVRSVAALAIGALVALAVLLASPGLVASIPALASLQSIATDSRLSGRQNSWGEAISMISQSPIFGWGPGSAGATLSPQFPANGHVTAHNVLLNYGVEGGLIGLALFVWCVTIVGIAAYRTGDPSGMAIPAFSAVAVFGVTTSVVDSLPITFALAVVMGLTVQIWWASRYSGAPAPATPARAGGRAR